MPWCPTYAREDVEQIYRLSASHRVLQTNCATRERLADPSKERPDAFRARIKYLDTVPDESGSRRVDAIMVSPPRIFLHLSSVSFIDIPRASTCNVVGMAILRLFCFARHKDIHLRYQTTSFRINHQLAAR